VSLLAYLDINIQAPKVQGQGFMVDAARLTAHSKFLREMLFDMDGPIGLTTEGSIDHPIVVQGCTVETFANFLGWLNHKCVHILPSLLFY
jgi:hypothetical protein